MLQVRTGKRMMEMMQALNLQTTKSVMDQKLKMKVHPIAMVRVAARTKATEKAVREPETENETIDNQIIKKY